MTKHVLALAGLCLWLFTPGTVHAAPRPFDFSARHRSSALRLTSSRVARGVMAEGHRPRALQADGYEDDTFIPTHVWLVPLILTGGGLVAGIAVCASGGVGDGDCGKAILGGIVVGAALGLGYLELLADLDDDEDTEDYGGCVDKASCRQAQRGGPRPTRKAQLAPSRGPQLRLPLGLMPTVGRVNDAAVLGLGRSF
ncbi:hypothetical protein LXT21_39590 [Myxococcus sp. K38C18041901]|uniref:hypothetical protein n=1 Tax=Myxococcus guangdongensis TaxID=2906760 RepID=UPI0020A743A7|nr:hypothetical protein [Myxococcus guangdongensis]MCP3064893.1 hypothetical protein [Myxococcus guangdongensis]